MSETYGFSNFFGFTILSVILYIPMFAALYLIFFVSKEKTNFIRWFANIVAFIDMILSTLLLNFSHFFSDGWRMTGHTPLS